MFRLIVKNPRIQSKGSIFKILFQMREARDRELRSGGHGFRCGRLQRSYSPVERFPRGGRGPSREPYMGGGGYWFDARPRRRKAFRQADRGQDRQREENWLDGRGDFSFHRSRFRYATREGRYSRERSRDASSWGRSFSSRSRHHSREGRALARRRNGGSHSRPRSFRKEGETRAAGGGRLAAVGPSQRELEKAAVPEVAAAESSLKRLVTFYFTNFPLQTPNFILRQGFEVCGMLEEVFVPNKLNMYGAAYGFVRFSNVRDVDKLLRAVNNVYFGHMRVKASDRKSVV